MSHAIALGVSSAPLFSLSTGFQGSLFTALIHKVALSTLASTSVHAGISFAAFLTLGITMAFALSCIQNTFPRECSYIPLNPVRFIHEPCPRIYSCPRPIYQRPVFFPAPSRRDIVGERNYFVPSAPHQGGFFPRGPFRQDIVGESR